MKLFLVKHVSKHFPMPIVKVFEYIGNDHGWNNIATIIHFIAAYFWSHVLPCVLEAGNVSLTNIFSSAINKIHLQNNTLV